MNHSSPPSVFISVDMKKNRLRIHKALLHQLSDPPYIQLLVNPGSSKIAIKAVSRSSSGDQTHKVSKKVLLSDNCVEIYSQSFVIKLKDVCPDLCSNATYRMSGNVLPSAGIAVFSLKAIEQVAE